MKVVVSTFAWIFFCVCVVHSLQAKLYIIDATKIAVKAVPRVWQFVLCKLFHCLTLLICLHVKAGLGKRINMIMQTVFFKLSGSLRFVHALESPHQPVGHPD